MKIAKVQCWVLRIPFNYPMIEETNYAWGTFVEVETDDGLTGHAMSTTPMRWGIREFINREAAPEIVGMDAMRPECVRDRLFWSTAPKYFMGAWNCAASLIDIALWDIRGKALSQPVWKLLGGAKSELPAYITFGPPWYDLEQLIGVAKLMVANGQKSLKMVVGAAGSAYDEILHEPRDEDLKNDIERVLAVRDAIGPDIELMVDANKSLNIAQATYFAKSVESANLTWLEDPVTHGDARLMAALRAKTSIPIAAGSTGTSDIMYLREYLVLNAVDYLQPNVRELGGYTQGLKAAGLAKAFNIPLAMGGNYPHINMHLHAGVPNGGRIEFHLQGWPCTEAVFDNCPPPTNGRVKLPETAGLGFTPKDGILDLAVD
jgi:L-rhamnonate dehydratase